ncbi:signal peptide-containing protein [Theileria equi strain WA]|uniref:Signal peptide-containing protein n=1 Tax=Theileria equi strain WA TaxID=1537102 RepID=L0AY98_THEEQ|nr:signal peptide-containing protein [Theileria equi strain WA]AFZ80557.1 signal peptide-containing protein [Theileria equi strain WA]|eukprot:XP_004830223.1 signal peptide-containing protein [Theileria equi strain WA]
MRYGFTSSFKLIFLLLIVRFAQGNAAQINHKLGTNRHGSSLNELCARLRNFDLSKQCNIISCIGARDWEQRYAIEKSFGLDNTLSSTISGPLKPRFDLWELKNDDKYTLVLDSDIHTDTDYKDKIAKICALSKCTVLYLSADDLYLVDGLLNLNPQTKAFVKKLSRSFNIEHTRKKSQSSVYIVLPSTESITEKFNIKRPNFDAIRAFITETFGKYCLLNIKNSREGIDFSNYFHNFTDSVDPNKIRSILSSTKSQESEEYSALVDYLSYKSFHHHKNLLKDLSKDIYNGNFLQDFGKNVESSFLDSLLSFYLLTYDLDASKRNSELESIKTWFRSSTDHVYLKLILLLEEEIKSQLRKALLKKNTDHSDKLVDELIDDYNKRINDMVPKPVLSRWSKSVLASATKSLRQKLDNIIRVHSELPNTSPMYSKEKASMKSNYEKSKKDRGLSFMLGLTAMIRERGYGNRQAFLNYNLGPLLLTLGYANDRDVAENKPGTGLMPPAFRIQPKLHLNINL